MKQAPGRTMRAETSKICTRFNSNEIICSIKIYRFDTDVSIYICRDWFDRGISHCLDYPDDNHRKNEAGAEERGRIPGERKADERNFAKGKYHPAPGQAGC